MATKITTLLEEVEGDWIATATIGDETFEGSGESKDEALVDLTKEIREYLADNEAVLTEVFV
jgi:hypothetical protein